MDFQEYAGVSVESIAITSRRYLGNKASIAPWIFDTVVQCLGRRPHSVADVFAGTGSVAWTFNHSNTRVIVNDLLYSNYVCLHAWLAQDRVDATRMRAWISALNHVGDSEDNYVSDNFGNRYWSMETARRIGAIRQSIEELPSSLAEKCVLLASLLYAADRVANTCGHYDAYRQGVERTPPMLLRMPEATYRVNLGNAVYCMDANELVRQVEAEVVYIDPPYNSRQYSDTYHVLENLARWERPPLFGVARKMDRTALKSRYCMQGADVAFDDLIQHARGRLLVVSYNNMGHKGDPRSNACIDDAALLRSLSRRGHVRVETRDFRAFNAGKRQVVNHQERLFICEVGRPAASPVYKGKPRVESNRAFHGSGM